MLMAEGHRVACLSGSRLRDRIENVGVEFHPLPPAADFDLQDVFAVVPELKETPPGLEWVRLAMERFFVDRVTPQHKGPQQLLREFPTDLVIGDDMFFGVLPMLLGPRGKRPPIIWCGTSFLHWCREDGAPHFLGLPPATTQAERQKYVGISEEYERVVGQSVNRPSTA